MHRYGELIAISKELIIVSHQIAAGILQRIVFTNRVRQTNYNLLFQLRIRENFKSEDFLRTRSYISNSDVNWFLCSRRPPALSNPSCSWGRFETVSRQPLPLSIDDNRTSRLQSVRITRQLSRSID